MKKIRQNVDAYTFREFLKSKEGNGWNINLGISTANSVDQIPLQISNDTTAL